MPNLIDDYLDESLQALAALRGDAGACATLSAMAERITASLRAGGKLLLAGNGGSAADAQHIAGEIVGRLWFERGPLPAVALTVDSSVLTAIGNDYGYEHIFSRQVQGLGRQGDVFLALSTSGRTPNVLRALDTARGLGLVTLGFTGAGGDAMRAGSDLVFAAASAKTSVIQQIHITAGHIVCGLVERAMFPAQ